MIKLLILMLLVICNANADELNIAFYSHVYHTDIDKNLNEDNNLIGLRYSHDLDNGVSVGAMIQDFDNSINKKTTLVGAFAEKDLLTYRDLTIGGGATIAGQIRKGYNVPFLANGYAYAEYSKLRVNIMYVPSISDNIDEVFITTFEFKLMEW